MQNGKCRLCGENKLLNFEHVPPKSTYNKNTRFKVAPYLEYMQNKNPLKEPINGYVNQGGVGFYSFCEACNNFLGSQFVREYKLWAEIGAYILGKGNFNIYQYSVYKQKPLLVLKQIISMFVAMNDSLFSEINPDLVDFVKHKDSQDLPEKYRVWMYLNNGPQMRYLPYTVTGNLSGGEIIQSTEIAFPPYGYVLTINYSGKIEKLAEITHFKNLSKQEGHTLEMSVAKLNTILPIPLDYRTKAEIEKCLDQNDTRN